ncbi:MAG: sugar transferase [Acidimicrobiales bacterium]
MSSSSGSLRVARTQRPGPGRGDRGRIVEPNGRLLSGHRAVSALMAGFTMLAMAAAGAVIIAAGWGGRLTVGVAIIVAMVVLVSRGHFRVRMIPDVTSRVPLIGGAVAVGVMSATVVTDQTSAADPGPGTLGLLVVLLVVGALVAQAAGILVVRAQWRRGRMRASALMVGSGPLAAELAVEIGVRPEYGVDVVGCITADDPPLAGMPEPWFGLDADLGVVVSLTGADRLIVAPFDSRTDETLVRVARWATSRSIPVFVVPRFYKMGLGMDSMSPDRARGYPLVRLQRAAHPRLSLLLKRWFDVAVSGTMLVVFAPVMAAVALAVKLTSEGPVLFGQERVGRYGRPIVVWKFRSMTVSDRGDTEWTAAARVTPVGALIRRLNLDELPQLWSIVRGDMSLVGPRPERPAFVAEFTQEVSDYDDRHRMPVGLTGLAQIAGLRGDTSISERVKYDNLYIDQWSFGTDLQILAKTVVAVVRQHRYERDARELDRALDRRLQPAEPPDVGV